MPDTYMSERKPWLFVDMDGVLARFHDESMCHKRYDEPGFFRALKPFEGMVTGLKRFMEDYGSDAHVCVLSACMPSAEAEKLEWLAKYFGELELDAVFVRPSQSKAQQALLITGCDTLDNAYLLDDYSANLQNWEDSGGKGIKFINNINARGWNGAFWRGPSVAYDEAPEEIALRLAELCGVSRGGETACMQHRPDPTTKAYSKKCSTTLDAQQTLCPAGQTPNSTLRR